MVIKKKKKKKKKNKSRKKEDRARKYETGPLAVCEASNQVEQEANKAQHQSSTVTPCSRPNLQVPSDSWFERLPSCCVQVVRSVGLDAPGGNVCARL